VILLHSGLKLTELWNTDFGKKEGEIVGNEVPVIIGKRTA
jgi:hypothetical protein